MLSGRSEVVGRTREHDHARHAVVPGDEGSLDRALRMSSNGNRLPFCGFARRISAPSVAGEAGLQIGQQLRKTVFGGVSAINVELVGAVSAGELFDLCILGAIWLRAGPAQSREVETHTGVSKVDGLVTVAGGLLRDQQVVVGNLTSRVQE